MDGSKPIPTRKTKIVPFIILQIGTGCSRQGVQDQARRGGRYQAQGGGVQGQDGRTGLVTFWSRFKYWTRPKPGGCCK